MSLLSVIGRLTPAARSQLKELEPFMPVIEKFLELKNRFVGIRVGEVNAQIVSDLFKAIDSDVSLQKAETIAGAIRTYCPDPEQTVGGFFIGGDWKQVLKGILTPPENSDTDNAIRCPHCSGLIVRATTTNGFTDVIECPHCGGLIINQ